MTSMYKYRQIQDGMVLVLRGLFQDKLKVSIIYLVICKKIEFLRLLSGDTVTRLWPGKALNEFKGVGPRNLSLCFRECQYMVILKRRRSLLQEIRSCFSEGKV